MKRIRDALVVTLAVVMLGGVALAQDGDGPRRRGGEGEGARAGRRRGEGGGEGRQRGQRGRGRRGPQRQGQRLQQVLRQLDLNERQREKIAEIVREQNAPMQAARQAMQAARESGDEEAMKAAREAFAKLREAREAGAGRDLLRRIAPVLTKTQREKFLFLMGPGGPFVELLEVVKTLELEPAQKRQIRQIEAQAKAEARMKTELKQKAKVYTDARKKVMDLLTDEQKQQLRRRMAARNRRGRGNAFEALDLTAEQQEAIEAIQAEAREKIANAETDEERREAMRGARREARRRIYNEVLTEEQKQQLREQMQQRGGRRGGGPGGRGGDGGGDGGGGRGGRRRGTNRGGDADAE